MTQRVSFNATRSHKSCSLLSLSISDHAKEKKEALGEVLNGDQLISAPYELKFKDDKDSICSFQRQLIIDINKGGRRRRGGGGAVSLVRWIRKANVIPATLNATFTSILYSRFSRMDPHSVVDVTEDTEVDVEFMYTVKWK
ncbi:hypothetical protein ACFE04_018029 [Oxalis oulophora]